MTDYEGRIIPYAVVMASKHDQRHSQPIDKEVPLLVLGEYEATMVDPPKRMVMVTPLDKAVPSVVPVEKDTLLRGGESHGFSLKPFVQALVGVADLARNVISPVGFDTIHNDPQTITTVTRVQLFGFKDLQSFLAPIKVTTHDR